MPKMWTQEENYAPAFYSVGDIPFERVANAPPKSEGVADVCGWQKLYELDFNESQDYKKYSFS